jgi:hypothetical protein
VVDKINKKSFRFHWVSAKGSVTNGIVTKYFLSSYTSKNGGAFPKGYVMVTWENNKSSIYTVQNLVSFAYNRSSDNPDNFINAIYDIDKE